MKEERMLILNMLNDGKITADEAVALLNAITATETGGKIDNFAHGVKAKAVGFAEKAEPKVKKAAAGIKNKSAEVIGNIKDKLKEKKAVEEECIEVEIEETEETEE